ncbi:DUF4351 domain-containing protein [Duganella radicis]|uniref:DUF4351 domain-containing protein n=1 Tax=Duganella radicis TaxID=551988 RepID=A0A6L6PL20_9BURK|nr:DUF4351 domain-containing protein [Duganella radicis]MTV39826.1 DUF4351 domain-containing protein [Duganella radicis]
MVETAALPRQRIGGDALLASHNPIAWVAEAHLRTQQARHNSDELYISKRHLTRQLFLHRWSRKRIIVLFKVINWMMVLPRSYQRRYWLAVLQLDKEQEMELRNPLEQMFFEDGMEVGMKQGLEQGLERGRKEGAVAVLERLLERRFGPLSKSARKKLAKASLAELDAWSEALLEAQSLKQVLG